MNRKSFFQTYKNCADEATLDKIWQNKLIEKEAINLRKLYDLSPLKHSTHLRYVYADNTDVEDLSPLGNLTLKEIHVSHTKVKRIDVLKHIPTLKRLNLSHTLIEDLSPLSKLSILHSLFISNTPIENVRPLQNLSFAVLDFSDTNVKDISALKEVGYLHFTNTLVSDLSSLRRVSLLDAQNTAVTDLTPLKDVIPLRLINVSDTKVSDISPLKNVYSLFVLNIQNTLVTDLSPLSQFIARKNCIIYWNTPIEEGKYRIYTKGCSLENPPLNIIKQGQAAILEYWNKQGVSTKPLLSPYS